MSFKLLKKVINQLRKTNLCPHCGSAFDEDSIFVMATSMLGMDTGAGLLLVVCPKCENQAFVLFEVSNVTSDTPSIINFSTKDKENGVTANEVLDMHNFLKTYKGDLSKLFNGK